LSSPGTKNRNSYLVSATVEGRYRRLWGGGKEGKDVPACGTKAGKKKFVALRFQKSRRISGSDKGRKKKKGEFHGNLTS